MLRALPRLGMNVAAVFTHPDDPHEPPWFDSVAALARDTGIPVHEVPTSNPRGPAVYERTVSLIGPDLILSAYFRALIPSAVLAIPPRGALNLHGSLLPLYRGRCPLNWVLIHGERETGMTLHHMTAEPDAGDIVGQVRLGIGPDETAPELGRRLEDAAVEVLEKYLPQIADGTAPRTPQDPARGSCFGRRRPEDGRFEWSWPARRIHDLVRAVTRPYPGARVEGARGQTMVWKTRVVDAWSGSLLEPGEIIRAPGFEAPVAGTGDGLIELLDYTEAPESST